MNKEYTKNEKVLTITAGVITILPLILFELILFIITINQSENNICMLAIILKSIGFLIFFGVDIKRVNSERIPLLIITTICFIISSVVYLFTEASGSHETLSDALTDGITNQFLSVIYYLVAISNFAYHVEDINKNKKKKLV